MTYCKRNDKSDGNAVVEFAILLPLLAILLFPAVDYGRSIHANMILIGITREVANQASRIYLLDESSSQKIMNSVANVTPPVNMRSMGSIFITQFYKVNGGYSSIQFKWSANNADLLSKIATCTDTDDNSDTPTVFEDDDEDDGGTTINSKGSSCVYLKDPQALMGRELEPNEIIYVVESIYQQPIPWVNLLSLDAPEVPVQLYSKAIFR